MLLGKLTQAAIEQKLVVNYTEQIGLLPLVYYCTTVPVLQDICGQQQIHVTLQKIYHPSAGRTPK